MNRRLGMGLLAMIMGWGLYHADAGRAPFSPTDRLREIAKTYKSFGRVDSLVRWGPEDCRLPSPPSAHYSKSADADTHGSKLYTVFAKHTWFGLRTRSYVPPLAADAKGKRAPAPVGQVLVKEAWVPEEVSAEQVRAERAAAGRGPGGPPKTIQGDRKKGERGTLDFGDHWVPFALKGQKWYRAARPAGLFVMFKLPPDTPDTDQGWVYGTVADDGQVTAVGRIAACMKCHQDAPHDRVFGWAE